MIQLLLVTVSKFTPSIWIPVILSFLGVVASLAKLLTLIIQNSNKIDNVHVLVNSNLSRALDRITHLEAIIESTKQAPTIPITADEVHIEKPT